MNRNLFKLKFTITDRRTMIQIQTQKISIELFGSKILFQIRCFRIPDGFLPREDFRTWRSFGRMPSRQKPSLGSIYSRNSSDYRQRIYSSPSFVAISVRSCWLEVYIRGRNTAPTGQRNPGPFQSWPPFKKFDILRMEIIFIHLIYIEFLLFILLAIIIFILINQFFRILSNFCEFLNSFCSLQTKFISIFNPLQWFFLNNIYCFVHQRIFILNEIHGMQIRIVISFKN